MFPSLLHGSEDSSHISHFHQLKHDPAVSRSRLAAHLQHNYPGSYVHLGAGGLWRLFVQNQFCCANVEEEVSPFTIYSRDKPTLFLSPNPVQPFLYLRKPLRDPEDELHNASSSGRCGFASGLCSSPLVTSV